MTSRSAWGHGLATITRDGVVLDTWFPKPSLGSRPDEEPEDDANVLAQLQLLVGRDAARGVHREIVTTEIDLDSDPTDASDVYLRLHLLSHRLVEPHGQNLTGLLDILTNVVWTTSGPCAVEDFDLTRIRLVTKGAVTVYGVDKLPRMVDYVVPNGVRIADANRVRLGAYLADGTNVMPEGFVNFNAGTLGAAKIQGRVSNGVTIGSGSTVGGGASIMPAAGPSDAAVSVGARCLLGANSGLGIRLGDNCVVEAGLYLTPGTKVAVPAALSATQESKTVKATDLAGRNNLLFRRNSLTGSVEVVDRPGVHG